MISGPRVAPTRINLLAARRRLGQVQRGASLIRRKRDALVRELFRLARPAADNRAQLAAEFVEAYDALLQAFARHGRSGLRALGWPARSLEVRIEAAQVWGISVSDLAEHSPIRRMVDARGVAPASSGPAATEAAQRFEALTERLLDAAAAEQRLRRIGDAVAESSRHLRTLEQRVAPALAAQIAVLKRALQEREREEYLRLKHVQARRAETRRIPR